MLFLGLKSLPSISRSHQRQPRLLANTETRYWNDTLPQIGCYRRLTMNIVVQLPTLIGSAILWWPTPYAAQTVINVVVDIMWSTSFYVQPTNNVAHISCNVCCTQPWNIVHQDCLSYLFLSKKSPPTRSSRFLILFCAHHFVPPHRFSTCLSSSQSGP